MSNIDEQTDIIGKERLLAQLEQLEAERKEKKLEIIKNKIELTTIEEGISALKTELNNLEVTSN